MKRNFVVGLCSGLIGSALLLMLLSAAGVVGARAIQSQPGAARTQDVSAAFETITATQSLVLQPQGGGGPGPVGPAFTYQGLLKQSGTPLNTPCDFQFSLWDSAGSGFPPVGGLQVGKTETETNVTVSNGLFNVVLNFNPSTEFGADAFNGQGRWLAISVRCPAGGTGAYTPLGRQPLWATPYAMSLMPGAVISGTAYQEFKVENYAPTGGIPAGISGEIYAAADGVGVHGINYTSSPGTYGTGVWGRTYSPKGQGVLGDGYNGAIGVLGTGIYTGVQGIATDNDHSSGVYGSGPYIGVYGLSSTGFAVRGYSSGGYAGYFDGNVFVNGNLSASGTKPFKIDNPLDPAKQYLYHYAVESPQVQNMYNGTIMLDVKGEAVVTLPDYFSAVNSGEFQYQLTAIGAPMPNLYIAAEIKDNHFQIAGGVAGKKVSWTVFGQRNDPWLRDHPQTDVVDKPAKEAGTYLYPEGYGQPVTAGVDYTQTRRLEPNVQSTAPTGQP